VTIRSCAVGSETPFLFGFAFAPVSGRAHRPRSPCGCAPAQRKQVVAFRTFLRTLVHELCHHLDYELFKLAETFHTEGFYKRESSLVNQLAGPPPKRRRLPA
jgi:hypothetical protein